MACAPAQVDQGSPFRILSNRDGFDLSRVHVLPRGEKLLVMDRLSGRWLYLPEDHEGLLRLLGPSFLTGVEPHLRARIEELRRLLIENEIGVPSGRVFDGLNTVIIKLTKACNIACTYCYDWEHGDKAQILDSTLAHKAIAEAIETCDGRLSLIFHGGEPTLVWDLVEDLSREARRLAKIRGIELRLTGQTNLTRLNDRVVEFSLRRGISWGVSVDGVPEVNDLFRIQRNGKGTYHYFAEALRRYPSFVRRCGVLSTITSANDSKLLQTAAHFHDLGMPSWDWSLFQPIGRAREASGIQFDIDALLESWDELFEAVVAGRFDGFPVMPVKKYLDNFLRGPGANMCMRPECGAARDLLSVSYDGTISACDCIDTTGPLARLGHLASTSFAEARNSPVAHTIRSRDVQHLQCGECIWFGVCGGTCLAHAGAVDRIWDDSCRLSLLAFERISQSISESDRLLTYHRSCEQR